MTCGCEWELGCGDTGYLHCEGCGGDACICACGGELECDGCAECCDPFEGKVEDPDDPEWPVVQ